MEKCCTQTQNQALVFWGVDGGGRGEGGSLSSLAGGRARSPLGIVGVRGVKWTEVDWTVGQGWVVGGGMVGGGALSHAARRGESDGSRS